ncbi:MAG: hypothetical protein HKP61_19945, partial [Dactylosporangium sp.]|nr:type II secretion system F family protein [Dactylosporangium sp.]NNJ63157.1 hypothetical protein [Dactylosporangium sp.]
AGVATQAETRADLDRAVRDAAARVPTPIAVTATVPPSLSGQDAAVTIGVSGGGQDLTTTTPVSFAVDPNAVPALETVRLRVLPMVVLYAAMGLVGLAIMIVGFIVVVLLLGRSSARERMRQLERIGGRPTVSIEKQQQADASVVMRTALAVSERAVQRQGSTAIGAALDRAGIALRPAEWMLARAAVAVAGAVVAALIIPWFLGVPFGGLLGWFATSWYRKHRTTKRSQRFGDLLPEALQLVVGALRSGFSLMQAIDAVVREGPEPVSGEFGRAMAEIRLGGEIEAALERTAERNGSRDLAWLVMAIRIQREVGGNLSEVLETAVETMRERGRLVRHVRALSAEGRLSAYVLVGMPLVLSAWMMVFRGEYIKPLVTEPLGFVMLGAGVVMITVGAFWISRLIKVEV